MSSSESSDEFWVRSTGYGGINARGKDWAGDRINIGTIKSAGNHSHTVTTKASTTGSSGTGSTGAAGGSGSHNHSFSGSSVTSSSTTVNNMQPYLSVYMWKRIS